MRIAIIGAGASGLLALIKLRETGYEDITCFEKARSLGGTWRDNRYPGIACDVPSLAYRYSFAPNADWSHVLSPGPEILAYLQRTAEQFGIEPFIRYDSEIVRADFCRGRWRIHTSAGDQGLFDVIVTATGVLHHPVLPDIPGLEEFEGPAFHTARWDESVSLAGKCLGIIGTGSSAVQIAGAVIDDVAKLVLFQRTAQWVRPLPNKRFSEEKRAGFRANPELLDREYERITGWQNTEFAQAIVGNNQSAYDELALSCQEYLDTVQDIELRERLTPDYQVGCKRLVMSDSFYEAMQHENAQLITEGIERIQPRGVVTNDGELHEIDVLVLATGFNTHQFMRPMVVTGKNGLTLESAWAKGNEGYRTVAVPGFPNWFMIGGPNSPVGNFSWLQTAETQFAYILQLIERLREENISEIAPKPSATADFNAALREQLPHTIWASGCQSWYIDDQGQIASWPWSFDQFVDDLRTPVWDDFELR